jgi:hypothetical protein
MRIKSSFSIKGKKWLTKYKWNLKGDDGSVAYGLCDVDKRIIWVAHGLSIDEKTWVWAHEYMHARLFEAGVTHTTGGISDLAEEIICSDFADFIAKETKVRWRKSK